MFTSALTVPEFAVLSELQVVPLRQVMGVSVQQIGWQYLPAEARYGGSELFCELDRVGHAWDQARRQALDRLTEEARSAGADAVVGVRLQRGEHDFGASTVDFNVVGTAVRWPGAERAGWPVLTALSAQEYWKLEQVGWAPAGVVAATAVFFVSQGFSTRWQRRATFTSNQELEEFSEGFSAARHTAVRYLASQADSAGGEGVVGVSLEHSIEEGTFDVVPLSGQYNTSRSIGPFTIGDSVQPQTGGADKRSGIVITIQATGTAIRRLEHVQRYPPETTLGAWE
jgi:uncharacterized protein YbjQ (UPF0145 family)